MLLFLVALVYYLYVQPSWTRLLIFLLTPEWLLTPIYILKALTENIWFSTVRMTGQGAFKTIITRLYGLGLWMAFSISSVITCEIYHLLLDVNFGWTGVDLDGKRKTKRAADSIFEDSKRKQNEALKQHQKEKRKMKYDE